MKAICFFASILIMFSCQQVTQSTNPNILQDSPQIDISNKDTIKADQHRAFSEFRLKKVGVELHLRNWKSAVKLEKLGLPTDTSSKVLGPGADTHIGSLVEDYRYNDIRLQFFGPPKGKDLWLMNMEVLGNAWETVRGIRVGDDREN